MTKEELLKEVKGVAPTEKITCSQARQLAEKLGVAPSEVGKICTEYDIKIIACELGCF